MNVLISACLLGISCRYNGTDKLDPRIVKLMNKHHLVPVCPEIYGGLPTPRDPSERVGSKVLSKAGQDVTEEFARGAQETLALARLYGCTYAVMKERSPSCGFGEIYDGTFLGRLIPGGGVTAELLSAHGVTVLGESRMEELLDISDA